MGQAVDLSIVIVNWNTSAFLADCLASIERYSPQCDYEVWVVDNASADGSAQMVRERFPWVRLIENAENVGFAAANNQAIRESASCYVLLLNPDTVVHAGALQALVDFMVLHPTAGASGARLLNPDGSLQLSCQPRPTLLREAWMLLHLEKLLRLGSYNMDGWSTDAPRQVDVVKGACVMAPRQVLQQVGWLDEDYFLYAEELDLCERVRRAGYEVYWVPAVVITHHGERSIAQLAEPAFVQLHVSRHRFFVKHHGRASGMGYRMILVAASLPRVLLGVLAPLRSKGGRRDWLTKARRYRSLLGWIFSGRFTTEPLGTAYSVPGSTLKEG